MIITHYTFVLIKECVCQRSVADAVLKRLAEICPANCLTGNFLCSSFIHLYVSNKKEHTKSWCAATALHHCFSSMTTAEEVEFTLKEILISYILFLHRKIVRKEKIYTDVLFFEISSIIEEIEKQTKAKTFFFTLKIEHFNSMLNTVEPHMHMNS